jgi:hypothetical protein
MRVYKAEAWPKDKLSHNPTERSSSIKNPIHLHTLQLLTPSNKIMYLFGTLSKLAIATLAAAAP